MTAIEQYKEFFKRVLKKKVGTPSLLFVCTMLALYDLISKKKIHMNNFSIKTITVHGNLIEKYMQRFSGNAVHIIPMDALSELKYSSVWKRTTELSGSLDVRIFVICNVIGTEHEEFKTILLKCGEELCQNTGVEEIHKAESIDFGKLQTYRDAILRPYQIQNKQAIYEGWKTNKSIMLQMPTGTGKTRLFVSIVNDICKWAKENNRKINILLLAHRKELIDQISNNVGITYGIPHGLIQAQNEEHREYDVQIGSVPTLNARIDKWKNHSFDVIIVDEAHHVKANSYIKILKAFPNAKVLGVTATPYRLNGVSFRPEFDDLIVSPSVSKFIKQGYLCDYDYYSIRPDSKISQEIAGIKKFALDGDYLDSAMMDVMDKQEIRANIIDTYFKYAKGKKGIVYTINCEHNDHICERFREAGVKAKAIDGNTPQGERNKAVSDFRKGKIDVLCNVNIFSEGFDCPDVEFILLARPTKSLALYLQQVGRGLRPAEGKQKVLFLDNVGLYNRFGFPSARRHWKHHFEGKYEKDIDNPHAYFSTDEVDKDIIFMDDYSEGNENVSLLHSSVIEDPIQIDEFGYIKDFDRYIEKEVGLQDTLTDRINVLQLNLEDLEKEAKIFKKYKVAVPNDIASRIQSLNNSIDAYNKLLILPNRIENIVTSEVKALDSPFQANSFLILMKRLNENNLRVHVVTNKDGSFNVEIVEKKLQGDNDVTEETEKEKESRKNINYNSLPSFITLTRQMIEDARTPNGGFTKSQLEAIGLDWPAPHDWIDNYIGKIITRQQFEQFNTVKYIEKTKVKKKTAIPSIPQADVTIKRRMEAIKKALRKFNTPVSPMAIAHEISKKEWGGPINEGVIKALLFTMAEDIVTSDNQHFILRNNLY